jgi:hypothetical protein
MYDHARCGLLYRISPGVEINVWFDGGPATGRRARFLGITCNVAAFLTTETGGPQVIYVPCAQIQAVSFSATVA